MRRQRIAVHPCHGQPDIPIRIGSRVTNSHFHLISSCRHFRGKFKPHRIRPLPAFPSGNGLVHMILRIRMAGRKQAHDQTQKARIPHSALYPFFMLVHLNLYFVPDVYFPHCCCSDGNFVFRSDSDEAPAPHLPLLAEHFPQPPEVRDYFSGGTDGCFGPEGLCFPVLSFQLPVSVCCCLPPPEQQAG